MKSGSGAGLIPKESMSNKIRARDGSETVAGFICSSHVEPED